MTTNQYLQSGDYATYGVPNATAAQVIYASNIIDGFLNRKEGILYTADNNGNPCYMTGLDPSFSCTLQSNINAGTNVSATISGPCQSLIVGEVGIIDRTTSSIVEPLLITSITQVNASTYNITIDRVINSHSVGASIDFGLLIQETKDLPSNRPITKLSKWPIRSILSGYGRYAYARRGDNTDLMVNQFNLLAVYTKFGGPPAWEKWSTSDSNLNNNNFNSETGELWVPAGILLSYYSQVRVYYVAGWTYTNLPSDIKLACANIINNKSQDEGNPMFKVMQAGGTRIEKFGSTYLDEDTKNLLNKYKTFAFV